MSDPFPTLDLIRHRLEDLGSERVWRPVPGPDGNLLARGNGPAPAELDGILDGLDLRDKSVADLGANLGYFSFLASRRGAHRVLGLDIDPEVVAVAGLLARLHGLGNVAFATVDFLASPPRRPCDLALLVDFIGRAVVRKGKLPAVVAAATAWGAREIFFTLREVYPLDELGMSADAMTALYPGTVRDGLFFTIDAVTDLLGPDWTRRPVAGDGPEAGFCWRHEKTPALFVRRT